MLHVRVLAAIDARIPGPWDSDFRDIEGVYLRNRGEFLIGLCGNEILAMGALRKFDDDTPEVKRMRVHPDHWRRGYGQAIFERLQARAIELGYKRLILDTLAQQKAAQQLYLKHGFRPIGRKQLGPFECLLFEKDLTVAGRHCAVAPNREKDSTA